MIYQQLMKIWKIKYLEWERESYIDKIYAGLKKYMNISKNIMNEKEKIEYKS